MANLDFFAARSDLEAVFEFLFNETDLRVFESYSEYGQELREFRSLTDLNACFDLGVDRYGRGTAALLQLWSPSAMSSLQIVRIDLDPRRCQGHTFRYRVEAWGLMQLYLGGVHDRIITPSHYGHCSEVRTWSGCHPQSADWPTLKRLSNRVQYHIRKRLAVAHVPGRPVLPEAYQLARSGYALEECRGWPGRYPLPPP